MPQLRTFSGFASTPNAGQAIVGAAGVRQRAEEAAMQAANERSRISTQLAIAQMENSARQAALQQQAVMAAQELEVQKAYQEGQLGLRAREVASEESKIKASIEQAAAVSAARMAMQRDVEKAILEGMSPAEAHANAAYKYGAGAELPAGAYPNESASVVRMPQEFGQMYDVPGQKNWKFARVGPESGQYFNIKPEDDIPKQLPFDPSLVEYKKRTFTLPDEKKALKIEKIMQENIDRLKSKEFAPHRASLEKSKNPDAELSIGDKSRIKEYNDQLAEIRKQEEEIASLRKNLENAIVPPTQGGKTNRVGRFEVITHP